jgi:hypothetical protein
VLRGGACAPNPQRQAWNTPMMWKPAVSKA